MAKDPAFLFYTGDFTTGTQFFSDDQLGKYLRLLMAQHQHGRLTEKQINFISQKDEDILLKFKIDETGLYYNERLEVEINKRKAFSESRRNSRLKSDEDNVRVYIVRDNVRGTHKIGSSVNPLRRYNELCNESNTTICENKDITLVWYSDAVVRIEESKLHEFFKNKRISGEWFLLNDSDLSFIFKKFKGTYVERTIQRTEDENENKDISIVIDINKGQNLNFVSPVFSEDFNKWLVYRKSLGKTFKSQISLEANYNLLLKLSNNNITTASQIINQSISNGYTGLFELNASSTKTRTNPEANRENLNRFAEESNRLFQVIAGKNGY